MKNKWYVSRQIYWPSAEEIVEIAEGGLDYANPDMLVEKYGHLGEGQEYFDPRKAVKAAIEICLQWREDGVKTAEIALGHTSGFTMPFEPISFEEATESAEKIYQDLPRCPQCRDLFESKERWSSGIVMMNGDFLSNEEYEYCSESCAEKNNIFEEAQEECFI